nr:translation initiation factor IF-2 N-terminal domain-containing protein [Bacillota bacterium]
MSSIKVQELAEELHMTNKDLLTKINSMGIEAKAYNSVLSDMDVIAVRNTVLRGKSGAETKIVKVAPKKTNVDQDKQEVKVVVKAAAHPSMSPESRMAKPAAKPQPQQQRPGYPNPNRANQTAAAGRPEPQRPVQNMTQEQRPAQGAQPPQAQKPVQQTAPPVQPPQAQKPVQSAQPAQQRPDQGVQQTQPQRTERPAQGAQQSQQHQRPVQSAQPGQQRP